RLEQRVERLELCLLYVTAPTCNLHLGIDLGQRPDGNRQLVQRRADWTGLPLGDVRRHGDAGAAQLRLKTESFLVREPLGQIVDLIDEFHRDLPRFEIPMAFDLAHGGGTFCARPPTSICAEIARTHRKYLTAVRVCPSRANGAPTPRSTLQKRQ